MLYLTNGDLGARIWDTEIITTTGLNLADACWHHAVHTHGASVGGQKLYVDGVLEASGVKDTSDFDWQKRINVGFSNDAALGSAAVARCDGGYSRRHGSSLERRRYGGLA